MKLVGLVQLRSSFSLPRLTASRTCSYTILSARACSFTGVVTTAGTVVVRVLMGSMCDKFGPRYCKSSMILACTVLICEMCDMQPPEWGAHLNWVHANSTKCAVHHIALNNAVLYVS